MIWTGAAIFLEGLRGIYLSKKENRILRNLIISKVFSHFNLSILKIIYS
jgi:hypothetical protein